MRDAERLRKALILFCREKKKRERQPWVSASATAGPSCMSPRRRTGGFLRVSWQALRLFRFTSPVLRSQRLSQIPPLSARRARFLAAAVRLSRRHAPAMRRRSRRRSVLLRAVERAGSDEGQRRPLRVLRPKKARRCSSLQQDAQACDVQIQEA